MDAPSAIEIVQAIAALGDAEGYGGTTITDPEWVVDAVEYIPKVTGDSGVPDGALLEIGPATRTPGKGDASTERRIIVVTFIEGVRSDRGDGTTSLAHFNAKIDGWAVMLSRTVNLRLGFGSGEGTYPNADVKQLQLQEPDGRTRLQGDLHNVHYCRAEIPVLVKRC